MYLLKRLTEASSAAGLGSILAGIKSAEAGDYITALGLICAGIAAILIPGGRAA